MKLFKKKTFEDILKIDDDVKKINEIYSYLSKKCKYGENLEKLDDNEKVLFLTMDFESCIIDGGVEQFLYNMTYDIAATLEAFEKLNRHDIKEMIEKTIGLFPLNTIPSNQKERISLMETMLTAGNIFEEINENLKLNLKNNYIDYINEKFDINL